MDDSDVIINEFAIAWEEFLISEIKANRNPYYEKA